MKKLALAICLLLASIAAQAQFEKGTLGSARKPVHFWQTVLH